MMWTKSLKLGKRLTVEMKKMLSENGFDYREYLYIKNTTNTVEFVNVKSGKIVMIEKGVD